MWSLANGPSPIVNIYSGCICNGIRFHTKERDNRRKSQNSGLVVQGDHHGMSIDFYGQLTKVWEMTYMFGHRVVLFQCEWFNTGSNRTFRTETHLTTIDVRSRWYQNDPFVLPSQVQQVFYVNDTKLGEHWKVVERFQRRGIWNVPELEDVDPDANELPIPNDVFQQDETTEIVQISIADSISNTLRRTDIAPDIIPSQVVLQSSTSVHVEGPNRDDFICDDNDQHSNDPSDDEDEFHSHSNSDTDDDIEP